jgi:hypothetical protein
MIWVSLKDMKESLPLEMAEYAIMQGIDHEPAFNWWVPQVLWLCKRIIFLVKKQKMSYLKKTMKFGMKVPFSVNHALKIDRRNGNTLWADAIAKEMKDVHIAYKCLNPGKHPPLDYKWIKCHIFLTSKLKTSEGRPAWLLGGT